MCESELVYVGSHRKWRETKKEHSEDFQSKKAKAFLSLRLKQAISLSFLNFSNLALT